MSVILFTRGGGCLPLGLGVASGSPWTPLAFLFYLNSAVMFPLSVRKEPPAQPPCLVAGSFRVSLFIDLRCPGDFGKGWRGDLGTFIIVKFSKVYVYLYLVHVRTVAAYVTN